MPRTKLADPQAATRPPLSYTRATNLRAGLRNPDSIPDYRFSRKGLDTLQMILDACEAGPQQRAWAVVGPYGSGKSIFAFLALQVLARSRTEWLDRALASLSVSDAEMAAHITSVMEADPKGYVPVVIEGGRMPLDQALIQALLEAAKAGRHSWAPPSFARTLNTQLQTLQAGISDPHHVAELFAQGAELARIAGHGGLVVTVDEFGKFLERAAWQGDTPDVIAAQYLAELASSNRDPAILFLVLVHQGFQHYASSLSAQQWVEWAKVQGRFQQIDFTESPEDSYDLIAEALRHASGSDAPDRKVASWAKRAWKANSSLRPFREHGDERFWTRLFTDSYPLNPVALYALPRLGALLGQNERTVFSFLGSEHPLGLRRVSNATAAGVGPHQVLDYFRAEARFASLAPDVQRRLSELDAALHRIEDPESLQGRVAKTIGALNLIRSAPELPASVEVLSAAVANGEVGAKRAIRRALDDLLAAKIIVFREFSGEYRLWQGSDFDFEAAITAVRERELGGVSPADLLTRELDPRPVVARRHAVETGAVRAFGARFVSVAEARSFDLDAELAGRHRGLAGLVLMLLTESKADVSAAEHWAGDLRDPRLIVAIPSQPTKIGHLAIELAALRALQTTDHQLQDDPVAQGELASRAMASADLLRESGLALFEPSTGLSRWFWQGEDQGAINTQSLNRLVSRAADEIYASAPRIPNELINRTILSTSWVTAVKKIIDQLLADDGEPDLGFTGGGPEVGIFQAVLGRPGLYGPGRTNGKHELRRPTKVKGSAIQETWEHIESFLEAARRESRSLADLVAELEAPPFGVKPGLMPLLIWLVLIYHRHDLSLFEQGTYLRDWASEDFVKFVKRPELYAVRWLVLTGSRGDLIRRLSGALPTAREIPGGSTSTPLPAFLRDFYGWYQGLPEYAKQTHTLSASVKDLRRAITSALDPIDLVFTGLPGAFGLDPAPEPTTDDRTSRLDPAWVDTFVTRFSEATSELGSAYTVLCDGIVHEVSDVFGVRGGLGLLRDFFTGLNETVGDHVKDATAKSLLVRAKDDSLTDLKWIESVGAALATQSPRFWMDHHHEDFVDRLALTALAFDDAKRSAFASQAKRSRGKSITRVYVDRAAEASIEIYLSDKIAGAGADLARSVVAFLDSSAPDLSPRQRQQVLATALAASTTEEQESRS